MIGAFKVRAMPINVNFRYVEDELAYLIGNAELRRLRVRPAVRAAAGRGHATDSPTLHDVHPHRRRLGHRHRPRRARSSPSTRRATASRPTVTSDERSPDDIYIIYTGGTTGMPKGVMWRQEDMYFALGQGIDAVTGERVTDEYYMARRPRPARRPLVFLRASRRSCTAPRRWGTMGQMFQGNTIVLAPEVLGRGRVGRSSRRSGVNSVLITGDAMGRPDDRAPSRRTRPLRHVER